jgi:hypothetical protein
MPKRSGENRDFMQVAREVVERAIGEKMDGTPLDGKRTRYSQPSNIYTRGLFSNCERNHRIW